MLHFVKKIWDFWFKQEVDFPEDLTFDTDDDTLEAPQSDAREHSGRMERIRRVSEEFDLATLGLGGDAQATGEEKMAPARFEELKALVFSHFREHRQELPAFPSLAARVFSLIEHPETDINELVRAINQDPQIAAQVIKNANSVIYARGVQILSIRDAVTRLGLRQVANIAAAASTSALFDMEVKASHEQFIPIWREQWLHAMTTAYSAGWLAEELSLGNSGQAFLGGMLHDIGKTIALRALGALIVGGQIKESLSPETVNTIMEESHLDLGSEMAISWELPEFLVMLAMEHHQVDLPSGADYQELHMVRVVSGLNELQRNPHYRTGLEDEVRSSADTLGLSNFRLRAISSQVKLFYEQALAARH
ncbi:MAG: HDOD domain-containing protein [Myxococcota bacterium]|jgi:putative nucleotidyltransferase with HDIG domain|nr:HDOD domain-containing protein [Myxococcota bacterium]